MARPPLALGRHGSISVTSIGTKKNPRWVARTRYKDSDGLVRKVEASAATKSAAEQALQDALEARKGRGSSDVTPTTRLRALAELWFTTEVLESRRAIGTRQAYRGVLDRCVLPDIGALAIYETTTPVVDNYLRTVAKDRGVPSAKLVKTCLTGMMSVAVRHGGAPANPLREVSLPQAPERGEVRALALDEVHRLRADLAGNDRAVGADLPDLVDVLLATGCRVGEVLALRWMDVDLEAATASISGTVVRTSPANGVPGKLIRQGATKGRKVRRLRLPPYAVELLRARDAGLRGGGELVFPSLVDTLRDVATVERQWRSFREAHPEWAWVKLHSFRKTVATAVDRAHGTRTASQQLGHASEQVTAAHYIERVQLGPDVAELLEQYGGKAVGDLQAAR